MISLITFEFVSAVEFLYAVRAISTALATVLAGVSA
jgi:hypothetical protein